MSSVIIHGHFYQPPRENPWTGAIDREDSARPYHDWNERIAAECYRANAFARVVNNRGQIEYIVNNYTNISFNFGPTLMSWLEHKSPQTYAQIIEADRLSVQRRNGHGNAIAQAYNHAILPLCNERDRRTQIRWGVSDFRHRFGRNPESLWLPETACNDVTMAALIDEGMKFVILSPHQADRVRPLGADEEWVSVADGSVDPRMAYTYFHRDGSGRSIAVFFYDGGIARGIAATRSDLRYPEWTQRLKARLRKLGRSRHRSHCAARAEFFISEDPNRELGIYSRSYLSAAAREPMDRRYRP